MKILIPDRDHRDPCSLPLQIAARAERPITNIMLNLHEFAAMPFAIDQIIQTMRAELAEYGAVLDLLDQQQAAIVNRQRRLARELEKTIAAHLKTVSAWGSNREGRVAMLALPRTTENLALAEVALFPLPMRPLVAALGFEISRLISEVLRRVRHNRMLADRTTFSRQCRPDSASGKESRRKMGSPSAARKGAEHRRPKRRLCPVK